MSTPFINLSALPAPSRKSEGTVQSFESLISEYADDLNLTKKDISKLSNLKKNGEYLLSSNNFNFVYEVIGMLRVNGFQDTYEYLEKLELKGKPSSKTIFNSILFEAEETLYQAEIARLRDEFNVKIVGLYSCRKCGSQNTLDTISSKQRNSDEALIYDITCQDCGNTFRRG